MGDQQKFSQPNLAAVIGYPIAHSLSPLIHTYWAAREGVQSYYIPVAVEASYEAFHQAADHLCALGFKGANVTIPHKEHAIKYCRRASPEAQKAGAANMISFGADGAVADNSDIAGFAAALTAKLSEKSNKNNALILGAGGGARAVALAVKSLGYETITVSNRTEKKARTLANDLAENIEVAEWPASQDLLSGCDLLVNTTSLGMAGAPALALDLDPLKDHAVVCDIVYTPLKTPLLDAAEARGLAIMDGLSMLMHQAAPGYKAWLGARAIVDDGLRARLEAALNARGGS